MSSKRCVDCAHFEADSEDSDGHVVASWITCIERPSMAGLKSFPFKNTTCATHKLKRQLT